MLLEGEYLCAGAGVVYGFSSAISSDIGLSFVDPSDRCCSLSLSLSLSPSSVPVIEPLASSWWGEPGHRRESGLELWEDSPAGFGGMGGCSVIDTGSSQCMMAGKLRSGAVV